LAHQRRNLWESGKRDDDPITGPSEYRSFVLIELTIALAGWPRRQKISG
jgi:hypothetical protein